MANSAAAISQGWMHVAGQEVAKAVLCTSCKKVTTSTNFCSNLSTRTKTSSLNTMMCQKTYGSWAKHTCLKTCRASAVQVLIIIPSALTQRLILEISKLLPTRTSTYNLRPKGQTSNQYSSVRLPFIIARVKTDTRRSHQQYAGVPLDLLQKHVDSSPMARKPSTTHSESRC